VAVRADRLDVELHLRPSNITYVITYTLHM
jgi:hypothetical protein